MFRHASTTRRSWKLPPHSSPHFLLPTSLPTLIVLVFFSSTRLIKLPLSAAAFIVPTPSLIPTFSNTSNRKCIAISRIWNNTRMSSQDNDDNYSKYILESPSAERNKGPIYDMVLSPIIFPQLVESISQQSSKNQSKSHNITLRVLELAAGCGIHTIHFVSSFVSTFVQSPIDKSSSSSPPTTNTIPSTISIEWHPSDPDIEARMSIDARVRQSNYLSEYIRVPSNSWILGGTSGGTACGDGGHRDRDGTAGAAAALKYPTGSSSSSSSSSGSVEDYALYREYFDLITCINMIHIAPWEATVGLMECAGTTLRNDGILLCYGPFFTVGGMDVPSNRDFDALLRSKDPRWGVRHLEEVIDIAKRYHLEYVQCVEMPANNLSVLFRKVIV